MLTVFVFICYKCNSTWKNRQCRNEELQVYKNLRAKDQEYHPLESST